MTNEKKLMCIGEPYHNQCCSPESLLNEKDITDYAVGHFHSLFIKDKKLYACGDNSFNTITPNPIDDSEMEKPYHVNHGVIKDKDICNVWILYTVSIVRTCDNELYYWGGLPGRIFDDFDNLLRDNNNNIFSKRSKESKPLDWDSPPLQFSKFFNVYGTKNTLTYIVNYNDTIDCRGHKSCNIGGYRDNIGHIFIDNPILISGKLKLKGVEIEIDNPLGYVPITVVDDEYSDGELTIIDGILTINIDDDMIDDVLKEEEIIILRHEGNKGTVDVQFSEINIITPSDKCLESTVSDDENDLSSSFKLKIDKCKGGLKIWIIIIIVVACVLVVATVIFIGLKSKACRRKVLPFSKSIRKK